MSLATRRRISMADMVRNREEVETPTFVNDIFAEEPVSLDVFVEDRRFLGNPPLFPKQYDAIRQIERIYFRETYISMVEEFGEYWMPPDTIKNFIYAEWGKGSGKDHFCRIGAARVAYLLSCLKQPQLYFGLAPQDEIHTINVATTSGQARRAFFKPLGTLMERSPWFKDKLRSEITDLATSIRLDKQLELVSGHSLAESFEGLNPILAVADEIGAFRAARELVRGKELRESGRTAEAILKVLRSSARSRFPQTFKLCAISYPRYLGDPIETLVRTGKADIEVKGDAQSRYFVSGPWATWEVNPKTTGPEDFQEDYDEDPQKAMATYECKPQRSTNRFFRNATLTAAAFPPREVPPLLIEYVWAQNDSEDTLPGQDPAWGWQAQFTLDESLWPKQGALYAVHADLAVSGDRAGISMCHVTHWLHAYENRAADDRPVIEADFITSFSSDLTCEDPDGNLVQRDIQLRWVRKLIRFLIEHGFAIHYVTLDGWQSVETIQMMEAWGIESTVQSIDRTAAPYTTLRDVVYDGRLKAYDDGIIVEEIDGLTLMPNGKIDHPADGSKDEADALAGAVMGALFCGGDEGETPERSHYGDAIDLDVSSGAAWVGNNVPAWESTGAVDLTHKF